MTHGNDNMPSGPLPEMPGCPPPTSPARRRLLGWLAGLIGTAAAAGAGVPIVGFIFGRIRRPRDKWLVLGPLDSYAIGATQLVKFESPGARGQKWTGIVANT